jgi:3-oxoacyl-[acyl-carrier-protein] synthase II
VSRRVVISGLGLTSPIGNDLAAVTRALTSSQHGVATMPDWAQYGGLATRLGAPVRDVVFDYPHKMTRSMGRVGLLSLHATDHAIRDSGLTEEMLRSGRLGLSYGSTHGSSSELEAFCRKLIGQNGIQGIPGSSYLRFMSHTSAANLAHCYGIRGRVMPSIAACASASQGIGYGFEVVRAGMQDLMLCGGAEELHFVHASVFDIMFATSTRYNDRPEASPRPFDRARDGLVVGEGAGTVVLEEYEHARRRGAPIYAEVVGYGTNCDGTHVTSPSFEGMAAAMKLALDDARVGPERIDYINAHGTGTQAGDIAESIATAKVFGTRTPLSSTKGHTGHTLGACGALEVIFLLAAMRERFVPETRNLTEVDPRCGQLDYVMGAPREHDVEVAMTNNFAFGGINTSLVIARL